MLSACCPGHGSVARHVGGSKDAVAHEYIDSCKEICFTDAIDMASANEPPAAFPGCQSHFVVAAKQPSTSWSGLCYAHTSCKDCQKGMIE